MKKFYTLAAFLILFSIGTISKVQASCNLTVSISPPSTTINVGGSTGTLTATALNNTGVVTYAWAPCSTLNSSTGASVISTPIGSTTYTVTAYDVNGCTATATTTVNVVDPSIPNIFPTLVSSGYAGSNYANTYSSISPTNAIQSGNITNTNYTGLTFASFTNGTGFTFGFNGTSYTSFGLNTNGYIWFTQNGGAPLASATDPLSNASANLGGSGTIDGIISVMGTFINANYDDPTVTANIGVAITGAAPNRICTIQWQGYTGTNANTGLCTSFGYSDKNRLDFQIQLYENSGANSNLIQLNYWNQTPICVDHGYSGEVGLRGTSNVDFNNRTASGWSNGNMNASAGGSNTATITTGAANWIGANKAFRFTPACSGTRTIITPSGTTDLCPGGSVDLTASSATAYIWYLNGVRQGNTSQTYTSVTGAGLFVALDSSAGCGIPSYVTAVTNNAVVTPSVTITSNPTPLCGTSATFTAAPVNGGCAPTYQWQLDGLPVSNIAINSGTYTNNALNANDSVQVIMTSDALCASVTAVTSNSITNSVLTIAPVSGGSLTVCVNASTSAFTDATAGGTWSITPGTGTASITTGGVVTGLTSGTVTVLYTYSNGSCTGTASAPLTVNAGTNIASITGMLSVCANSTTQLSDTTSGGTWSSGTPSVATVDGSGLVTGIEGGTSLITYISTSGCTNTATATVTVNSLPHVDAITGTLSVCMNSTTPLSDVTTGGTWSSGSTSAATIDATSGLITGVSGGNSVITYTTAPDGNGCIDTTTTTVTVNPLPTATDSSSSPVCYGSALDLFANGGTDYSWTGPNSFSSNQQNPVIANALSPDSGTYTVSVTDAKGCTATTSLAGIVYPYLPTPVISQVGNTLYTSTDPSYYSYQWFDSTTLIPGATDTFLVVTHNGNYNLRVSDKNGCIIAVGVTVTYTGIPILSSQGYADLVSLSPNPASSQLNIHTSFFQGSEAITISTINVLGETVQEEKVKPSPQNSSSEGGEYIINIVNLPAGIYFLQLKSENGNVVKKFIKE